MIINAGNIIEMKKMHPCGSSRWEVLRAGADFRLKCCGCGRMVDMTRRELEKNARAITMKSSLQN